MLYSRYSVSLFLLIVRKTGHYVCCCCCQSLFLTGRRRARRKTVFPLSAFRSLVTMLVFVRGSLSQLHLPKAEISCTQVQCSSEVREAVKVTTHRDAVLSPNIPRQMCEPQISNLNTAHESTTYPVLSVSASLPTVQLLLSRFALKTYFFDTLVRFGSASLFWGSNRGDGEKIDGRM